MIEAAWPGLAELCSGVAARLEAGLAETGEVMAEVIRSIMSSEDRVLGPQPRPQSSLLVTAAAVSAGGTWQHALWPAVAMECVMAAADVFDDIADGEASELQSRFGPGVGVAVLFAGLGAAVHRWASDAWLGRIFLVFGGATALALASIPGALRGYAPAHFLAATSAVVASAAFTTVFLWFPRPLRYARWLIGALLLLSVCLVVRLIVLYGRGEGAPPALESSLFMWLGGNLVAGLALLGARSVRPANRHVLAPLAPRRSLASLGSPRRHASESC